ncbi:DNA adenine methyltransferase YhdJ [Serratia fonticola]|uniref:DNA-methyltransferase n=1 Tax=Serratia fonticola TaxID=47917 RepID=UPI002183DA30|nr:site-specific DNA-methyltransferase [Serratia fonticola]CAI2145440.1 DNA adenine methyltransferase YhdJ [Serratia fonticola]
MIYQLNVGRCEEVLRTMADNSVDAIVTDPPYGLKFMGNKWDYQVPTVEQWKECLRVLKPGGHLLAFGGSRTYHRLVVNIEDAGFEIRDQLMWIYGSGFPKSKNLTDEHAGKGTALKPAHEPIVMARKSLVGTVEGNVDQYGTGALNIDLCRVPTEEALTGGAGGLLSHVRDEKAPDAEEWKADQLGRWPANVLHDGSEEVISEFPKNAGARAPVKGTEPTKNGFSGPVKFGGMINRVQGYHHGDQGSAARFFYCAKVSKSERDEGMERFVPFSATEMTGGRKEDSAGINNPRAGAGRTGGARNNHPTVKPVDLMRYLCRLVTPAGGVVLDPFMGSGSTGKAALLEGLGFIGIELNPDHLTTAAARIGHSLKVVSESPDTDPGASNQSKEQQTEPQIIPGDIPDTTNTVWPQEVNFLFDQVATASSLPAHLQNKLRNHINRLKLEGTPEAAIIQAVTALTAVMGATA